MAFPISPGVFVQDSRCPPEWQSKGVVLFVGPFAKGPVGVPVSVRTARQAEMLFGADDGTHVTATTLRHFFEQGGRTAKVLRVAVGDPPPPAPALPKLLPAEDLLDGVLAVSEFDPGPDSLSPTDPHWREALAQAMATAAGGGTYGPPQDHGEGLHSLAEIAPGRVEMLAAPVLSVLPSQDARGIYRKLHELCVEKDIFLLLDPPADTDVAQATWFEGLGLGRSQNAIGFAPHLVDWGAPDRPVPPSGAVAGLLDRIACERGIWAPVVGKRACLKGMKVAPAPAISPVAEAPGVAVNQLMDLAEGVALPQDGVLSRAGKDAPRLRVLRVLRKTRLTLRAELDRLMVETETHSRRSEARLIAEALMVQLWQDGALKGDSTTQAFRVTIPVSPQAKTGEDAQGFELCVGLALQTAGRFHWVSLPVS